MTCNHDYCIHGSKIDHFVYEKCIKCGRKRKAKRGRGRIDTYYAYSYYADPSEKDENSNEK